MKRILLTVEYDGTAYAGWQRQLNGLAVQQVMEEALTEACGHPVAVTGASRTDAGVHALGQTLHFDTDCTIPADKFPFVLNNRLPPDIRVHAGREVPPAAPSGGTPAPMCRFPWIRRPCARPSPR